MTQISGALRIFLAAAQPEGYIFYRQVKRDRLQPLPLARLISLKPQTIQPPPRLKSDPDRSPAIANMPPTPSATNSPRYPTSLTIAESDFDNCLPIGLIVLQ
ncbi:hypothetical protein [Microcoleus sp. K5-D4]|uniref:hypothetical protein n=1 Tax=Microcoleus sp. K5-D4 TaxID=2818801 RepID=UPI002FD24278